MVWNIITAIFTIAIFILVLAGFVYTDIQIQEAKTTTANLEQLLNKSSEQLEALNQATTEIAHQTIMEAYQVGFPYRVEIKECNYNEEKNKITYRLIVYDKSEDDNPSTIKFLTQTIFSFYTVDKNNQPSHVRTDPTDHKLVYVPGEQTISEFFLDNIFEQTKNVKDEILYVRVDFGFAPYSDAKDVILIEFLSSERPTYLNAFAKFDDQNIWVNLPEKENTKCN